MLTSDLAQSWQRGTRTGPRLIEVGRAENQQTARDLIEIVRGSQGIRRGELDEALQAYVGVGTDYKTVRGLIKLLTDECTFETVSVREPAEMRRLVFGRARRAHPVTERNGNTREEIICAVATELGVAPEEVANNLYADLFNQQRLVHFEEMSAEQLLERYNLAQAQALLYRCVEMHLWTTPQRAADARQLFDAIKAYRLIHQIKGTAASGYEVQLTGPVSMFHRSQKYGIQMAVFLPALLLCRSWRMRAEIKSKTDKRNLFFELDSTQKQLQSHYVQTESDDKSLLERLLASWTKLDSEWRLQPSTEVVDLGESAFVPDLVARHENGKQVYIEAFGFWTPKHLERRLREFAVGKFRNFMLLASDELRCSREEATNLPPNVIIAKTVPDARSVAQALDRVAAV